MTCITTTVSPLSESLRLASSAESERVGEPGMGAKRCEAEAEAEEGDGEVERSVPFERGAEAEGDGEAGWEWEEVCAERCSCRT